MSSPAVLYAERLTLWSGEVTRLRARESAISLWRLAAAAITFGLLFWKAALALLPLFLFIGLVIAHERVVTRRREAERRAAFYERGLGRFENRWQGAGDSGEEFNAEQHPYARDFDLFGRGSLFELISLAATSAGRRLLARWMTTPSMDPDEIRSRQRAVAELRENLALREDLNVAASSVAREMEAADLAAWASEPPIEIGATERLITRLLPIAVVVTLAVTLPSLIARLVGWTHPEAALRFGVFADMPAWPLVLLILAAVFVDRKLAARTEPALSAVERAEPALALLARLLERLEKEQFTSDRLARLHARLIIEGRIASAEIERLRRLIALLDARRNQFFAPFAVVLLWAPTIALRVDAWRLRSGVHIADWIDAVGEVEALSSFASFAYEHPEFAIPEIAAKGPLFEATGLGHPLIAGDRRVTNDVRLDATLQLLVVSGSNMSGKSTMMRSIGIAAALALAGAPVCAGRLRIAPTAIAASIQLHDSLQENASRFYAEILRIRQVMDLSTEGPLLFLLDEILAGTNSHDRRIGAEAIIRKLIERGAAGLVSTHDLALAQIADSLAPRAANVHFEDRIEEGRVIFDYRMREGVVTRSNALALMRSVGIEV